jgi:hypothetical protein
MPYVSKNIRHKKSLDSVKTFLGSFERNYRYYLVVSADIAVVSVAIVVSAAIVVSTDIVVESVEVVSAFFSEQAANDIIEATNANAKNFFILWGD